MTEQLLGICLLGPGSHVTEQRFARFFCSVLAESKSVHGHVFLGSLPGNLSLIHFYLSQTGIADPMYLLEHISVFNL